MEITSATIYLNMFHIKFFGIKIVILYVMIQQHIFYNVPVWGNLSVLNVPFIMYISYLFHYGDTKQSF